MKSEKVKISAIIIARNEGKKIRECLESLRWVDEIVLIDSGSLDKTKQVAKHFGAKITDYSGGGYSDWRNEGLKKAHGDWVLYVDADERVTPELKREIIDLITNYKLKIKNYNAYAIPRKNIVLGREMKYGGWSPDYVKRLFKRKKLSGWSGRLHEEPAFEGRIDYLENSLLHLKENNISDMVDKTNKWSDIEAKLMFEAGHPKMNVARFATAMFREAWMRLIIKRGFLDGVEGIIYNSYQVWSKFVTYAKLWEMQLETKTQNSKLKT
jgi:glycosyltransferase involved in cell wall biosynthesis